MKAGSMSEVQMKCSNIKSFGQWHWCFLLTSYSILSSRKKHFFANRVVALKTCFSPILHLTALAWAFLGELGNLFRDAVVVMCVLCLWLIQRNQNKILRPINKVSGKEVTEFVGNMFLIYSKPNHFSDATGDKLDRNFICKVEKKHQSSKMCRRQTADFF